MKKLLIILLLSVLIFVGCSSGINSIDSNVKLRSLKIDKIYKMRIKNIIPTIDKDERDPSKPDEQYNYYFYPVNDKNERIKIIDEEGEDMGGVITFAKRFAKDEQSWLDFFTIDTVNDIYDESDSGYETVTYIEAKYGGLGTFFYYQLQKDTQ